MEKLLRLSGRPALYESGTSVMWTDPHIAQRLLELHTDPDNDMASRSAEKIDLAVDWILSQTRGAEMDILDLGCGPGLYAEKLASRGHRVTGVDFSQNSIAYAMDIAARNNSGVEYHCADYLDLAFEERFDLATLIYLDFCVLKPWERGRVLDNVRRSLKPGGLFIFDVINGNNIEDKILKPSWEVSRGGFWRDGPHMVLNNGYHYPEAKAFVNQHIVVDREYGIESYLFSNSYYEYEGLEPVLKDSGFCNIMCFDDVLPEGDCWSGDNVTFYIAGKGR
jgi:SAM-dependent methyltransferase